MVMDLSEQDLIAALLESCNRPELRGLLSMANFSIGNLCNTSETDQPIPDAREFDALKRLPFATVAVALCVVVTVVGTLGNTLVVVTVATTVKLRTATNIFIANLAIADIFVCAFDLPLNLFYLLTDYWPYGRTLCHIIPACFGVVIYASTLSMTMIAVDRFILIVLETGRRITPAIALILVVVIAVTSGAVASPIGIYSRHFRLEDPAIQVRRSHCLENWPSFKIRRIYSVLTLAIQFVIPLIVIGVLYFLIFWRVRATRKQVKNLRRRSKTNRMLVAVVSLFAIAWTPYQLLSIASEFDAQLYSEYYKFVDLMLRVLAMSSSCINPFLYGWMNDAFRTAFLGIIRRGRASVSNTNRSKVPEESVVMNPGTKVSGTPKYGNRLELKIEEEPEISFN